MDQHQHLVPPHLPPPPRLVPVVHAVRPAVRAHAEQHVITIDRLSVEIQHRQTPLTSYTAVTSPEPGVPADGGCLLVHQGHAVDEEDRLAAPGQLRPRLPDQHGGDVGLAAPRAQVHDRVAAPSLLQQLVLMIIIKGRV